MTSKGTSSRLFVLIVLLGSTFGALAQLVGTDAFMQGQYIQVGVSQCAVFGSNSPPGALVGPLGTPYYPTEPGGLGFVADSDQDGWAVGFPPYCGDYFVPGSPVEGWAIQFGSGPTRMNTDQPCSSYDIPGSITSYTDVGTAQTVVWEGNSTAAGWNVDIKQSTVLPVDKLYFVTQVTICNNGAVDLVDFYYGRNVDPDNDQPWSGDFTTFNQIVLNPPLGDSAALVTAQGLTYGCFIGLGARDTMARATYGSFFTQPPYNVWNGIGHSLSGTNTADEAISLAFKIPLIPVGECRCVSYAYILDPADLNEALDATASVILFADTTDITTTGVAHYCVGDSTELQILGADEYDWVWTPSDGLNTDTGTVVWASPSDTTLYTAVGTNGFCGDLVRTVLVIPDPPGIADAGLDKTICLGDTVQLDGVAGAGSVWWTPAVLEIDDDSIPTPMVWPPLTTEYILHTESLLGCPGLDTVVVIVNPLPPVDAQPDTAICIGADVQLGASGADTYQWSPVDFLTDAGIPNPISTPDTTITYVLEGTDVNGCVNYDTLTITVNPLPEVDAGPDQTIDLVKDETAMMNALSGTAISWMWEPFDGLSDPNIVDPLAQPEITTTYIVTVTDGNGCVNSDTITIEVLNEFAVIIPDAFTPNGDGLNDVFHPVTIGLIEFIDASIYNRWGELVWYSNDRNDGWDGTYKGIPQEIDTYVVVVRIVGPKGEPVKQAGTTTIIR